ncbi:uncharacterized protein DFL_007026 [Arthrobotrys flagrans]|uniref:Uncharacterized protein n=1 Tax=Arthrobotrys flagrans TaxID=97331 RepID=A0A436ZUG3_ARTFL|nr:hypothetical protein DFL_007026 [Arthrobotrys flagrans]
MVNLAANVRSKDGSLGTFLSKMDTRQSRQKQNVDKIWPCKDGTTSAKEPGQGSNARTARNSSVPRMCFRSHQAFADDIELLSAKVPLVIMSAGSPSLKDCLDHYQQ